MGLMLVTSQSFGPNISLVLCSQTLPIYDLPFSHNLCKCIRYKYFWLNEKLPSSCLYRHTGSQKVNQCTNLPMTTYITKQYFKDNMEKNGHMERNTCPVTISLLHLNLFWHSTVHTDTTGWCNVEFVTRKQVSTCSGTYSSHFHGSTSGLVGVGN